MSGPSAWRSAWPRRSPARPRARPRPRSTCAMDQHAGRGQRWCRDLDHHQCGFRPRHVDCFPTEPPSERELWNIDLGIVDVHPVTVDGWWGDCTRSFQCVANPGYRRRARRDPARPRDHARRGPAGHAGCDLFCAFEQALRSSGSDTAGPAEQHRPLVGGGHLLRPGLPRSVERDPAVRGAWAIEPFVGNHLWGVKTGGRRLVRAQRMRCSANHMRLERAS